MAAFEERRLDHTSFPYAYLDATYLHVREDHHVLSNAVVIATGVDAQGLREVLGFSVGDSEDEVFWRSFLTSLRKRGLQGVRLVISDQHAGLVAALRRGLQGTSHQRCQLHFARNLLACVPKSHQEMVAAALRTVFPYANKAEMSAQYDQMEQMVRARFSKAADLLVEAKEEVLAFAAFPREHWRQIQSTNPLERVNRELKRRCRVVGIFPNEASVVRLAGAVLVEVHDEWQAADRRYFSEGSMAKLSAGRDNGVGSLTELSVAS